MSSPVTSRTSVEDEVWIGNSAQCTRRWFGRGHGQHLTTAAAAAAAAAAFAAATATADNVSVNTVGSIGGMFGMEFEFAGFVVGRR